MDSDLHQIIYWLAWGFVMGAGWTLASWLLGKILR